MKDSSGPSIIEIIIGGLLSLSLGACLAIVYLMVKPIDIVRELPKKPDPAKHYFVDIPRRFSLDDTWIVKRNALLRGEEIAIDTGSANTWLESFFQVEETNKTRTATAAAAAAPATEAELRRGTPRVRINAEKRRLETAALLDLNLYGFERKILLHSEGHFETVNGRAVYHADTFYVGRFPVHRFSYLFSTFAEQVQRLYPLPEEDAKAWSNLGSLKIEGEQIVLKPAS